MVVKTYFRQLSHTYAAQARVSAWCTALVRVSFHNFCLLRAHIVYAVSLDTTSSMLFARCSFNLCIPIYLPHILHFMTHCNNRYDQPQPIRPTRPTTTSTTTHDQYDHDRYDQPIRPWLKLVLLTVTKFTSLDRRWIYLKSCELHEFSPKSDGQGQRLLIRISDSELRWT